jgi:hypothetical protein
MNAKKTNNYPTDAGNYAIDERVSVLFQPDTLVAEEFLGNYRRKTPLEPEKTLVLAVLEDGIRCFQDNASARSGKKKKLFKEAQQWLFCDDSDWLFSFTSVCTLLGFDPDYIRRGLRRWEKDSRISANKEQPPCVAAPRRLAG